LTFGSLGAALVVPGGAEQPAGGAELASAELVFDITTEPSGATVLRGADRVGVTPLKLAVPHEGGRAQSLALSLVLDGYEPALLVAEGVSGVVPIHQPLVPRHEAAAPEVAQSPPSSGELLTRPIGAPPKAALRQEKSAPGPQSKVRGARR
jgi:hypothetical protein